MRLWTSLEETVFNKTILKNMPYRCDNKKCKMLSDEELHNQYQKAYRWLGKHMEKTIGPPPEKSEYPVWAWYKLRNQHERPNLQWVEFKGYPTSMVLIECEIEESKVLLSDEELWTSGPLNNAPCFCKQTDDILDKEISWYYDDPSVSKQKKDKWKISTWNRIFDIESSENVQATFWELRPEQVVKTWIYKNA